MKRLAYILIKYHPFFLFLALEWISIAMIRRLNYQDAVITNSTLAVAGSIQTGWSDARRYFQLPRALDSLRSENARLRAQLRSSWWLDTLGLQVRRNLEMRQCYEFIPAEVTTTAITGRENYLTLNKGHRHGIRRNMGVITSSGVVGIVHGVTNNLCLVRSVLNRHTRIRGKSVKTGEHGAIRWPGGDPRYVYMDDISQSVLIEPGDSVVTMGAAHIFPEGIPIGVVESVYRPPGQTFSEIRLELSTSFTRLEHAYVVTSIYRNEFDSLQSLPDL